MNLSEISIAKKKILELVRNEGFLSLLKLPFIYSKLIYFIYSSKLKIKKINQSYSLNNLVNFTFQLNNGFIKPFQIKSEILQLLKYLKINKPKIILEIGTCSGGTLFLFTRIAAYDATIISIDLPFGLYGGGYLKLKKPLYKSFILQNQNIILLRCDSHDYKTILRVKQLLNREKIDFLFIDGDHRYNGVKKDFEMYHPLVNENGIVAFHDILINYQDQTIGVHKFWNEIKTKYNFEEIVEDWNQNQSGIGILKKNESLLNNQFKS